MIKLSPSILAADFANLAKEIKKVEDAGVEYLHIDVMDGHFVPNITIGAPVVKEIRKTADLVFDVHLMISRPDQYIDDFIDAGADIITVHYESEGAKDLNAIIEKIKSKNVKVGVSIKPKTDVRVIYPYLDKIDMVLVMTVEPGFGGQAFIEEMHDKIKAVRKEIVKKGLQLDIQVDGGVTPENVAKVVQSGANVIVAGSAIFKAKDVKEAVKQFRENSERN